MKILICGAGIAGLTLAYWLHHYGHTPVIIEKAPDIRTDGYILDFTGSGWDVANRMGIIPQLQAKNRPVTEILYKNMQGKTTARIPTQKLFGALSAEGRYLGLDRSELVLTLYEAVKSDVVVRFGVTLKSICQSVEGVTAGFTDGGADEAFDLIIGADGIHSVVRQLAFGDEREFEFYLGYYAAAFYTPSLNAQINEGYEMFVEPNLQFGIYGMDSEHWLSYVVYKTENEGYIPPQQRLATLKRHLQHTQGMIQEVINLLSSDDRIYMDVVSQIQMPKWSNNRVALIGDAAHCMTLVSGQGASMAMAGAYFLAQELNQTTDYHRAFRCYEQRLRPHIEQRQAKAKRFASTFVPDSHLKIMLNNWVFRMIDFPPVASLVGKQVDINSIIGA